MSCGSSTRGGKLPFLDWVVEFGFVIDIHVFGGFLDWEVEPLESHVQKFDWAIGPAEAQVREFD